MKRFDFLDALAQSRPGLAEFLEQRLRQRRSGLPAAATTEGFPLPAGASIERDLPYGDLPAQQLDVYSPPAADSAPVLFMVHGGGWRRGDKAEPRAIRNKVTHWVARGYVVVSVNYRLLPGANPLEQADDVALALAFVQSRAATWGADSARVLAMGHSAGAHLLSLLTADPSLANRQGAAPWLGTVALDSGAYDVVQIMQRRHFALYDRAFGADPDFWRDASPTQRLQDRPLAPMLLVCSSRRADAVEQARAFAAKAQGFGGTVRVWALDLSHGEINEQAGLPGAYTEGIDAFMGSVGLP